MDGGATWTELKNGLPSGDKGRIGLATFAGDNRVIYAIVEADAAAGGTRRRRLRARRIAADAAAAAAQRPTRLRPTAASSAVSIRAKPGST